MELPDGATIEGLRHARNAVWKQLRKCAQRAESYRRTRDELKRRVDWLEDHADIDAVAYLRFITEENEPDTQD